MGYFYFNVKNCHTTQNITLLTKITFKHLKRKEKKSKILYKKFLEGQK